MFKKPCERDLCARAKPRPPKKTNIWDIFTKKSVASEKEKREAQTVGKNFNTNLL